MSYNVLNEKLADALLDWKVTHKSNKKINDFYEECLTIYSNLSDKKRLLSCYNLMTKMKDKVSNREIMLLGITYILDQCPDEAEKLSDFDLVLISDYAIVDDIKRAVKEIDHETIEIVNSCTDDYDTKIDYLFTISGLIKDGTFDKNKIKDLNISKYDHTKSLSDAVEELYKQGYKINF